MEGDQNPELTILVCSTVATKTQTVENTEIKVQLYTTQPAC